MLPRKDQHYRSALSAWKWNWICCANLFVAWRWSLWWLIRLVCQKQRRSQRGSSTPSATDDLYGSVKLKPKPIRFRLSRNNLLAIRADLSLAGCKLWGPPTVGNFSILCRRLWRMGAQSEAVARGQLVGVGAWPMPRHGHIGRRRFGANFVACLTESRSRVFFSFFS